MRELYIGRYRIADDESPFIVAEIGHNHGGSLTQAKALILAARRADVQAVKFQKRDNKALYTEAMYDASYNSEHAFGPTYGAHREALELGWDEYVELKAYAESWGLVFFMTAFDLPSVDFLVRLGVTAFKVASGDLLNWPLLDYMAGTGLPMMISTGGHDAEAVRLTVNHLREYSPKTQFALLQCTAMYPASPERLNLRVIESYRTEFPETVVGLSDHEDGIYLAPVAYLLGARIFEKHLTLNRSLKGSDHAFSVEPHILWTMTHQLGSVASALGDGQKVAYPEEEAAMRKMGKSLVAAHDLPAGHLVRSDDIAIKSPGGGLSPHLLSTLIGRRVAWAMKGDDRFERVG